MRNAVIGGFARRAARHATERGRAWFAPVFVIELRGFAV